MCAVKHYGPNYFGPPCICMCYMATSRPVH